MNVIPLGLYFDSHFVNVSWNDSAPMNTGICKDGTTRAYKTSWTFSFVALLVKTMGNMTDPRECKGPPMINGMSIPALLVSIAGLLEAGIESIKVYK